MAIGQCIVIAKSIQDTVHTHEKQTQNSVQTKKRCFSQRAVRYLAERFDRVIRAIRPGGKQ